MTDTDCTIATDAPYTAAVLTSESREWIKPEIVTLDLNTAQAS